MGTYQALLCVLLLGMMTGAIFGQSDVADEARKAEETFLGPKVIQQSATATIAQDAVASDMQTAAGPSQPAPDGAQQAVLDESSRTAMPSQGQAQDDVAAAVPTEPALSALPPPPLPPPAAGDAGDDAVTTFPMGATASGAEAVAKLGNDLPAVAAAYERSAEDLTRMFSEDKDLFVDSSNRLLYACSEILPPTTDSAAAEDAAIVGHHHHHHHHHRRKLAQVDVENDDPLPGDLRQSASGVPLLHSRESSRKKIYLDFDGHTTRGPSSASCSCLC
jgi:hypothetical protein